MPRSSRKSKLFSGAATEFGAEPEHARSASSTPRLPGMLPVINGDCVEQAVKTGLGLNAQINLSAGFDRKNYFYADLPPGYQISQYQHPIVGTGEIELDLPDGSARKRSASPGCIWSRMPARACTTSIPTQDLHRPQPRRRGADGDRVASRTCAARTRPRAYLRKLRSILRYLGTCDGNMEEGSMRCDVNVSVRKPGEPLRHALRGQERQLDPLRHAGDRVRGAAPDRGHGRAAGRSTRKPGCSTRTRA